MGAIVKSIGRRIGAEADGTIFVQAVATLHLPVAGDEADCIIHEVASPGLFGIDAASDEEYIADVYAEQRELLAGMLAHLGVTGGVFTPQEDDVLRAVDTTWYEHTKGEIFIAPDDREADNFDAPLARAVLAMHATAHEYVTTVDAGQVDGAGRELLEDGQAVADIPRRIAEALALLMFGGRVTTASPSSSGASGELPGGRKYPVYMGDRVLPAGSHEWVKQPSSSEPSLIDTLASEARTALDDPAAIDLRFVGAPKLAVDYAIGKLDDIIGILNPSEDTRAAYAGSLSALGRQLAERQDAMKAQEGSYADHDDATAEAYREADGALTRALDALDEALAALAGEDDERWWDVELSDDGDELRRYAVKAASAENAEQIARAYMPKPSASVSPLYVEPDDADIDYDAVIGGDEDERPYPDQFGSVITRWSASGSGA